MRRCIGGWGTARSSTTSPAKFRSGQRDEAAAVIPDELVDDAAIVGDIDHARKQIALWEAAGVTMMVVGARSPEQINELAALL